MTQLPVLNFPVLKFPESKAAADAVDRLYAAPLADFVGTRRALAADLRSRGEIENAKAIALSPKPTRTLWGLNQVARNSPGLIRSLLGARDQAVAAQERGDAEAIRRATRDFRSRVAEIVRAVQAVLQAQGGPAATVPLRRLGETLQAAASNATTREQLMAGRLTRDLENNDPFSGFAEPSARPREPGHPTKSHGAKTAKNAESARDGAEQAAQRKREGEQADQARRASRALLAAASRKTAQLEEAARHARELARQAETALVRARSEAERALREADAADARAKEARAELSELSKPRGPDRG